MLLRKCEERTRLRCWWENLKKERVLRDVHEIWNDEEISFVSQVDQVSVKSVESDACKN